MDGVMEQWSAQGVADSCLHISALGQLLCSPLATSYLTVPPKCVISVSTGSHWRVSSIVGPEVGT